MKKYHIITFGCQANLADSEAMAKNLEKVGCQKAPGENNCDILIYNTCSVRQMAEDRIFGLNKKMETLKKTKKNLKIILTGCMTHYSQKELRERLPHVDFFIEIKKQKDVVKILELRKHLEVRLPRGSSTSKLNGTSALIPITYGCNNFCSYCIVPFSRGRETHRPAKDIIKDVKEALRGGAKEIWLLGQNVNSYKNGKTNFANLVKTVNALPGKFWIRFTSPHPKDFSDELIKILKNCEKYPHYLNLPVQSGNNQVLKKMNRPYTIEQYKKLTTKIRKAMPDMSLSTDMIVGFPGETKKQFMDSAKLMREIKFDMAFLSEYSPRSKTLAWKKYKDNVPHKEKEWRKNYLNEILKKTSAEKNKGLIGKTIETLDGRTESNKPIRLKKGQLPKNKFVKLKVVTATAWALEGEVI